MYFSVKCEKTQVKPKVFYETLEKTKGLQQKTQEPKIGSKKPRSWEKTQGAATLPCRVLLWGPSYSQKFSCYLLRLKCSHSALLSLSLICS